MVLVADVLVLFPEILKELLLVVLLDGACC
jgi:hypothetical protein